MIIKSALLFFLGLIILSCNNNLKQTDFKLMLPDSSKVDEQFVFKSINELVDDIDLKRIDRGVDSFELRIWNMGIINPQSLLIIKYSNKSWNASQINFDGAADRLPNNFNSKKLTFNINAKLFYDSLLKFDLLDIPSQLDIPNFKDRISDGESFIIEIAGKNYYKFIDYHCPEFYNKEVNNKKIVELLHFISRSLKGPHFFFC